MAAHCHCWLINCFCAKRRPDGLTCACWLQNAVAERRCGWLEGEGRSSHYITTYASIVYNTQTGAGENALNSRPLWKNWNIFMTFCMESAITRTLRCRMCMLQAWFKPSKWTPNAIEYTSWLMPSKMVSLKRCRFPTGKLVQVDPYLNIVALHHFRRGMNL